ncbi:MAG TPA: choice-of-anchor Q domain-containing protein [Nitrolancea sp.]|jgi:hypothetical protein|nr:choice-of-anchor Q domain-containing protein [Nitrolancea sp.]
MNRRFGLWVIGLMFVVASGLGLGVPLGALADTSYSTCPSFATFQNDVQAISTSGTITFEAANCTLDATSTIDTQAGSKVTIDGNGLTMSGGTADAPGAFDLIDVGAPSGSLTLDQVTLEYGDNGIGINGGSDTTTVTLTSSTVRGSQRSGIVGEVVSLTNSSLTGNGNDGIDGDAVLVTNSTVSDNSDVGISGFGQVTVTFSTITDNGSDGIEVGIQATFLTGTLLSGNSENCDTNPPITDRGYNLSTDNSCSFSATGSQNSVDAGDLHLGTLGNYGGPTETIPLLTGSIAIDAIPTGTVTDQTVCLNAASAAIVNSTTSDPIVTDQRGVPRPQGIGCDIGAYEQATTTTTAADAMAVDTDAIVTLTATVTSPAGVVNEGTVTFSVTDASSNPAGTSVQGLVAAGSANADFVPTGLAPGSYIITASYHDASGIYPDSQDTNTLTITAGLPSSLTLSPGDTSANVGDNVTETATVTDADGNLVADGTPVQWSITGLTSGTASISTQDTTTTGGQASLTYTNTTTGVDTVAATAGTSPDTATNSAAVTWTPGLPDSLTLAPGDTSATVGGPVTETATVKDQYGILVADGTTVTFIVTGSNTTSGTVTTVNGLASFTYSGTFTGADTLTATATGGTTPSASAVITWTAPNSTPRATLTIVNPFSPQIDVVVQTGTSGGITIGTLTYVSRTVTLSHVQLSALVVNGSQSTVYGQALANGTPVTFRLNATQGRVFGTVRLRLSNGYDSGNQPALVRVTP